MDPDQVRAAIAESDLVTALPSPHRSRVVERLVPVAAEQRLGEGQSLWRSVEHREPHVALLVSGLLLVSHGGELVDAVTPGIFLGFSALLPGRTHSASVISQGASVVLVFPAAAMLVIAADEPPVWSALMTITLALVAKLNRDVSCARRGDVRARTQATLHWLSRHTSVVALDQSTLAQLVGCSHGALEGALRALAKDGAIEVRRGRVEILDRAMLSPSEPPP